MNMEIIFGLIILIFIDIVLSVDNAVLIASATRDLPEKRKKIAEILGALGAMLFRLIFIVLVIFILDEVSDVIFLYILGGLLLIYLGLTLTKKEKEENNSSNKSNANGVLKAIVMIVAGDLMMSFDNAVVLGGIVTSSMNGVLLQSIAVVITLVISLVIIVFLADKLGRLMHNHQWIAYLASGILIAVGIEMLLKDALLSGLLDTIFEHAENIREYIIFAFSYIMGAIIATLKYFWDDAHKPSELEKMGEKANQWINDFANELNSKNRKK